MIVVLFLLMGLLLGFCKPRFYAQDVWQFSPDLYFILVAYLAYRRTCYAPLIILFPLSCLLDVFGHILGATPFSALGFFGINRLRKIPLRQTCTRARLAHRLSLVNWLVYLLLELPATRHQVPWFSWQNTPGPACRPSGLSIILSF
jgi:rod shape-determining protein MreD